MKATRYELAPDLLPGSLEHLRWNWGDAYTIWRGTGNLFHATRRDGKGDGLTAADGHALRRLIIDDYSAEPVPRDLPDGQEPPYKIPPQNNLLDPCPSCGWGPESHDEYGRCPVRNRHPKTLARLLGGRRASQDRTEPKRFGTRAG